MNYRSHLTHISIVLLTVAQFLGMGGVVRSASCYSRVTISRNLSDT